MFSNELNNIEKFFKYDIAVKNILFNVSPKEEYKYNNEAIIEYSESLNQAIKDIEFYINSILRSFNFLDSDKEYFNNFIKLLKNELINCGTDFNKLKNFYEVYLSNMREELVNLVGSNIAGYYMFSGVSLNNAKSINELLHVVHQTIVNNENNYKKLPVLDSKGDFATLYGKENPLARYIFSNINENIDSSEFSMMSLGDDRILIMVRDHGHALSIEIEQEKDKYYVKYFLPKICNVKMVNELNGVRKVDNNSKFTTGIFETTKENLPYELIEFITKVPTDFHMRVEGGMFYREEEGFQR